MKRTQPNLKRNSINRITLVLSGAALLTFTTAWAADRTWDGGGDTAFWGNNVNWAANIAPAAGDSLFFVGTTRLGNTNDYAPGTLFSGITFATGGNPAGAFQLFGSSVTLGGGITNNQVVTPQAISLPLSLSATRTVSVVNGGFLTLGGVISGAGGVTKVGNGDVTLSGANAFSGGLSVLAGSASVSSDGNLGAVPGAPTPGNIVLNNGTLHVTADFMIDANRGIAVGNAGGGEGRIDTDDGDSLVYGGIVAGNGGAGGLTKGRFGDVTLSGANTYTGPTAIKVGTISLDFTAGGTSDIINSASALQLGGENSDLGDQSFAAIEINGADGEANTQTFNGASLDIGTSRIVANSGAGGSATLNLGALTHTSGGNVTILLPANGAIKTTSPNVNGILGGFAMVSDGSIDNGILAGIDYAAVDGSGNVFAYNNYTIHTSGTIAGQTTPSSNFRIDDSTSGDLVVAPDNTGVIDINTLNLNQSAAGRGNQNFSIVVGTNNTLRLGSFGGISRSDDTPNSAPGGDLTWVLGNSSGGANGVQDDGTLTAGGADNTPGEIVFTLNNRNQSSGSLNVEVKITDNGAGPVTVVKSGRGSMKFRGHNTYSGGTYIMQGRFQLAGSEIGTGNPDGWGTGPVYIFPGAQAFPSGIGGGNAFTNEMFLSGWGTDQENTGAIRMGSGAEFAGTINLFGDTQLGGGGGGSAASGGAIISGKITGGFGLDIGSRANVGGGHSVAILTNPNNDWTGDTRVVGRTGSTGNGRLVLGADDVIPNGFGKGNMIVGLDTGGGASTKTLDLNGHNETVNGLLSDGNNSQVFIENNGTNAATLTVGDNNQSGTYGGTLRDGIGLVNTLGGGGNSPLALTKIGGGRLTLTGANTYSGATTVNGGTLEIAGGGSIGSSASIQVNSGGTLDVSGATALNLINPVTVSGGSIVVSPSSSGTYGEVNLSNARVRLDGLSEITPSINATTVNVGGATNYIDVQSVGFISGYPAQFTIIKYTSLNGTPNFGLGDVPRSDTVGFVSNNIANGSIDLVLLDGPKPLTWTGNNGSSWDNGVTTNWLAFGVTPTVFQGLDAVIFDDSAATTSVSLNSVLLPSAIQMNNPTKDYTFGGSGLITGTSDLYKDGAGMLTIANAGVNDFSGGVVLTNGTLQVGNGGTGGNLPAGSMDNNGSLIFNRSDALVQNLNIAGAGTVEQAGTGMTTLNGASTYVGLTTISQGTLKAGNSGAFGTVDMFTIDPGISIQSGATLDVGGQNLTAEPVVVSGAGVGGNGAIVNSEGQQLNALLNVTLLGNTTFGGAGRWDIRGTGPQLSTGGNAYNLTKVGPNQVSLVGVSVDFALADINVQQGLFAVETTSGLGNSANTLTVSAGATLQFFNTTTPFDKVFVLNGTGTNTTLNVPSGADNTMSGLITLNGAVIVNNGSSDDNLTIQNAIGGSGSLTKNGGSILRLNGNGTYSGNTVVNGGTLLVDGTLSGGGTLSNAVGTTIMGKGGNTGPVHINGGLTPGVANVSATFDTGPLTLTDTATLTFDLGKADELFTITSDRIAVTGTLTVNGVVDIALSPGAVGNLTNGQVITLIQYSSGSAPTAANFNLLPAPAGYTFSLVDPATTPNAVRITVVQAPSDLTWAGNDATNPTFWDLQTTVNWTKSGGGASDFRNGDKVSFTDSSATRTVTLIGNLAPDSVNFNHSFGTPYTLTGAGKITGSADLDLGFGGGNVVVANSGSNDFTGAITVNSGTLQIGNGGTTGNLGSGELTNNGVLLLNRSDDALVVGNSVRGNGMITNNGSGIATLAGANAAFFGPVVVANGTLRAASGSALGDTLTGTTIHNGATLDVGGQVLNTEPVVVSGSGVGGQGAIVNSVAQQLNAMGNVTLEGNTTFGGSQRWDIRGGISTLSTFGMAYNLTKVGANQISFVGTTVDAALADINIQSGVFGYETTTSGLGNPANTLTIHAGAQLMFWNSITPLDKVIILNGDPGVETVRAGSGQTANGENSIVGPVTLNGMVRFGNGGDDDLSILSTISGPGGIHKEDGGDLLLAGVNTYTGDTFIDDGLFILMTDGSIGGSSNIIIDGGEMLRASTRTDGTLTLQGAVSQTLRGAGTLDGTLNASAAACAVSPGNANGVIGTLTVSNAITLGGTTYMEVDKVGAANDRLVSASGSISYGGALNVTALNAGFIPGDSFKLFDAPGGYSGSFAAINPPTPGPNLFWITSQLTVNGTLGVGGILITNPSVGGGNFQFEGFGGTSLGTYVVLCTSNVSLPLASWTPVLTNSFDINGNFSVSIPLGVDPAKFYTIREQ